MKTYAFRLYITAESIHSQNAAENLRKLCRTVLGGACEIEIIDVGIHPEQAEADKILATPTLIRLRPAPPRRLIGDLSDMRRVLVALGLQNLLSSQQGDDNE
ncbi:MAG: hypothetical protein OHK0031_15240 [Anaerolineales bacterium]